MTLRFSSAPAIDFYPWSLQKELHGPGAIPGARFFSYKFVQYKFRMAELVFSSSFRFGVSPPKLGPFAPMLTIALESVVGLAGLPALRA